MKVPGARKSRVEVALACSLCHSRNYLTRRASREGARPLVLSKFCKQCGKHTPHVESK